MQPDRSNNHYHSDPRVVTQIGIGYFKPGQMLYLETNGKYELAIAKSHQKSQIAGMVWKIYGADTISIRVEPTPVFYEHPLGSEWYNKDENGVVLETSPNIDRIPGNIGTRLWLSDTIDGAIQNTIPLGNFKTIVGYKTKNGFIFRPERVLCNPSVVYPSE